MIAVISFANGVIASFKVGVVPFYELQKGDVFYPQYLLGANAGVRGVRFGCYAGPIKAIPSASDTRPRSI